jgi:membrane-bound ClpP family serine protease
MTTRVRLVLALVLMSVGLVASVVDSESNGWSTLGTIGVACLVLAIAAEIVALRRLQSRS